MDTQLPDFADLEQREERLIKLNEQLMTLQRALLSAPNKAEKKRLKKLCKGVKIRCLTLTLTLVVERARSRSRESDVG